MEGKGSRSRSKHQAGDSRGKSISLKRRRKGKRSAKLGKRDGEKYAKISRRWNLEGKNDEDRGENRAWVG